MSNVMAHVPDLMRASGVAPGDRVLQWVAVNFVLSGCDLWCPLAMGCALVVAPAGEMKDVARVVALVQQHSIASVSIVPSMCQV